MNQRFTSATIALLLAIAAPAGVGRAMAEGPAATPAAPASAGSPTQPAQPAPLPEPKITQAQAEAALKQVFKLPQPSATLQLRWNLSQSGDRRTWDLHVTIRQGNGSTGFPLATVDAVTGRVLRYGAYSSLPTSVRTGPLTAVRPEDEAKARAWALVQKLAPEKAATLKAAPAGAGTDSQSYYSGYGPGISAAADSYTFTWVEYHEGVPFPASSVSVGVHKQSLDYTALDVRLLDGIKFQAGPAKVTADEALNLWRVEAKPLLMYQPLRSALPYAPSQVPEYKLMYLLGTLNRPVDAMTGTWLKTQFMLPDAHTTTEPEAVPAGSVTPLVPHALPLSEAEGRKLAAAVLEVPDNADLHGNMDPAGPLGAEPEIRFDVSNNSESRSIAFTPKTGLIRYASRYQNMAPAPSPAKPGEAIVTPEQEAQSRQAAIAAVQTYYSTIRDQLKLEPQLAFWGSPEEHARGFRFTRYVNGIAVPNEYVNVTIDLDSMKWRDLSAGWTTGVTFPDPAKAVAAEAAQAAAMADRKPILMYQPIYETLSKEEAAAGNTPQLTQAGLAYTLLPQSSVQIDALTGKPTAYDGFSLPELEAAYKKVTGHWAEGELQFMLSRRILRPDELKPDAPLTRAQAVTLLLNRNQRLFMAGQPVELPFADVPATDPAYGVVRMAWTEGWLRPLGADKSFRPGSTLTRAEFAEWAARALGLGNLARSGLAVTGGYKDLGGITGEQRNAVNFLRALGVLGSVDTFRPGDALTQAEGAAITVRILNQLLTDKP